MSPSLSELTPIYFSYGGNTLRLGVFLNDLFGKRSLTPSYMYTVKSFCECVIKLIEISQ